METFSRKGPSVGLMLLLVFQWAAPETPAGTETSQTTRRQTGVTQLHRRNEVCAHFSFITFINGRFITGLLY